MIFDMICYRICERKKDKLYTLFHGINGSREMLLNQWMSATIKDVYDGSRKTSKMYRSGFHVLSTLEETRVFGKKFRKPRDLVIVKCEIGSNFWQKSHSLANVLLAQDIRLIEIVEEIKINKL